jgi:membrane protein DedA with SNARE-associated domain
MKNLLAILLSWGPTGLLVLAILDGAGVPVPGGVDVLILYLAAQRTVSVVHLAAFAILGSTIGNLILFSIARKGGEVYVERHTISPSGARFRKWFQHYGLLTVFISAMVPLPVMPMKIFVLCAGALGSKRSTFLTVFVSARIVRYSALAYLGEEMGHNALPYLKEHVGQLVGFAAVLFIVLFLLIKIVDWRRERMITAPE